MLKVTIVALLLIASSFANLGLAQDSAPALLVVFGLNGGNTSNGSPQVLLEFPSAAEDGSTWPVSPFPISASSIGAAEPLLNLNPISIASGINFAALLSENGDLWTWGAASLSGQNFSVSNSSSIVAPASIQFSNASDLSSSKISCVTATNSATIFAIDNLVFGFGTSNSSTPTGLFGPSIETSAMNLGLATQLFALEDSSSTVKDVMCTSLEACSLLAFSASNEPYVQTWGKQYGSPEGGVLAREINSTDLYDEEPETISLANLPSNCNLSSIVAVTKSCFFARCAESSNFVAWGFNEGSQCSQQTSPDGSLLPSILIGLEGKNISKISCGETYCISIMDEEEGRKALAWGEFGAHNFSESRLCSLVTANSTIYECHFALFQTSYDNSTYWVDVLAAENESFLKDSNGLLWRFVLATNQTESALYGAFWDLIEMQDPTLPFYVFNTLGTSRHSRGSLTYMVSALPDEFTDYDRACMKPAPFVGANRNASCVLGFWVFAGSVNITEEENSKIPSRTMIYGNYEVAEDISLNVNATSAFWSESPLLNVSGCISILGTISVLLEDEPVAAMPAGIYTVVLWEGYANATCEMWDYRLRSTNPSLAPSTSRKSSAPMNAPVAEFGVRDTPNADFVGDIILDPNAPRPRCRTITMTVDVVDTDLGRTQVILNFNIQIIRGCDRRDLWWIVLLGVSGIVIVLTAILLTTFQCISRRIEKQADKEWEDR